MRSKAGEVFIIPELLERILLSIHPRQLAICHTVSQTFFDTIKDSIRLQRHLFLQTERAERDWWIIDEHARRLDKADGACESRQEHIRVEWPFVINDLLARENVQRDIFSPLPLSPGGGNMGVVLVFHRTWRQLSALNPHSSLLRMALGRPAAKDVSVFWIQRAHRRAPQHRAMAVNLIGSGPNGAVTLEDIMRKLPYPTASMIVDCLFIVIHGAVAVDSLTIEQVKQHKSLVASPIGVALTDDTHTMMWHHLCRSRRGGNMNQPSEAAIQQMVVLFRIFDFLTPIDAVRLVQACPRLSPGLGCKTFSAPYDTSPAEYWIINPDASDHGIMMRIEACDQCVEGPLNTSLTSYETQLRRTLGHRVAIRRIVYLNEMILRRCRPGACIKQQARWSGVETRLISKRPGKVDSRNNMLLTMPKTPVRISYKCRGRLTSHIHTNTVYGGLKDLMHRADSIQFHGAVFPTEQDRRIAERINSTTVHDLEKIYGLLNAQDYARAGGDLPSYGPRQPDILPVQSARMPGLGADKATVVQSKAGRKCRLRRIGCVVC